MLGGLLELSNLRATPESGPSHSALLRCPGNFSRNGYSRNDHPAPPLEMWNLLVLQPTASRSLPCPPEIYSSRHTRVAKYRAALSSNTETVTITVSGLVTINLETGSFDNEV